MRHTEQSYRREWAVLTGRSEREIYVPRSLAAEGKEAAGDRLKSLREEEPCSTPSAPGAGTSSPPSST